MLSAAISRKDIQQYLPEVAIMQIPYHPALNCLEFQGDTSTNRIFWNQFVLVHDLTQVRAY